MDITPQWLRRARFFCGFTAKRLAEEAGLTMNYVQRLERGDRNASADAAARLCRALGVFPDEVSFDSKPLLRSIDALIEEHGRDEWCALVPVYPNGKRYYVDCKYVGDPAKFIENPNSDCLLRLRYARTEVETQIDLREEQPALLAGRFPW